MKADSKEAVFQEIALARFRGKDITIDEGREALEAEGFWTAEDNADLLRKAKNAEFRRLARTPFYDEDGNREEIFNVVRHKGASSEQQNFFVFASVASQEDFEWVIRDRVKRIDLWTSEVGRLLGVYEERFGKKARTKFQQRLNLDFEVGA